jgi:Glycosyltransferases, probably involved in cell wall biogenesis
VLDDASSDETATVVRTYQASLPNLQLLEGQPVPEGWLGKPWACHQLAQAVKADYYLFIDADIRLGPDALKNAVAVMQRQQLSLYTLFPKQEVRSLGEKLTVPVAYYTLATLIPLSLVARSSNPAFRAANGQFMMLTGGQYHLNQWHLQVGDHQVEDMAIMQAMKEKGLKVAASLTHEHMSCRMYTGFREAVQGFSKNFRAFYADSWVFMGFFLVFGIIAPLLLVIPFPAEAGLLLSAELLGTRLLAARLLGYCQREAVLLAFPQMAVTVYLAAYSLLNNIYKQNQWKGRPIP